MKLLEVKCLSKTYKTGTIANENLNLSLRKGEILGIVGPNGSGKTTLIRQILNLLKPTSGEIVLFDKDLKLTSRLEKSNQIAYVPQNPLYFPALTVEESLVYPLKMLGFNINKINEKLRYIYKKTPLSKYKNDYAYTLSGGNKKLLLLASAILQDKKILILDEPTSMVDIVTKQIIWDIILDIKQQVGIILSSHDMNEVQKLSDEVYFLVDGKFVHHTKGEDIKNISITNDLTITISPQENQDHINCILKNNNYKYENKGYRYKIYFENSRDLQVLFSEMFKFEITGLNVAYPSLEKEVINIVRKYTTKN